MKKLITKWTAIFLATVVLATGFSIPSSAESVYQNQWIKDEASGKIYYYDANGEKVTGWNTLKEYANKNSTTKYKYYFKADGTLVTDLFTLNYNKWIKKDIKLIVNTSTHNLTFYAKDSKTGKYNIPLKTVVCSTSRKKKGTKAGKNCRLEKTSATRWFIYTKSRPFHYYQWGVKVKHGNFWFHSSRYSTTNNRRLETGLYNDLGTNQTTSSVRLQAINAKIVYDIATKTYKKRRTWVSVTRKTKAQGAYGPFGIYTLENVGGEIKNSVKYDPTDPNIKSNKKIYKTAK